jgi:hypothetical protein
MSEKDFWKKEYTWGHHSQDKNNSSRVTRGRYCDALYGTRFGIRGLLPQYCEKNDKRKWVLMRYPRPGEKIYK